MAGTFVYSDLHPTLNITDGGEVVILYDDEAITQSIKNILATITGEQVRNPIGSKLVSYLFQPMSNMTATAIKSEITRVIKQFEPRVNIARINITPNQANHYYDVALQFNIVGYAQIKSFSTKLRTFGG